MNKLISFPYECGWRMLHQQFKCHHPIPTHIFECDPDNKTKEFPDNCPLENGTIEDRTIEIINNDEEDYSSNNLRYRDDGGTEGG